MIKGRDYRKDSSPHPQESGNKAKAPSQPPNLPGVYTHSGADSARSTTPHQQEVGQVLDTPWVPISASPSAPHGTQTSKRHPNLAKYNVYLGKNNVQVLFNPESGFKVVVEMRPMHTGGSARWCEPPSPLSQATVFSLLPRLLISIMIQGKHLDTFWVVNTTYCY